MTHSAAQTDASDLDVFLHGALFSDLVFSGLSQLPSPGREVYASELTSCAGGIANLAIAAARLGLRTGLAAAFGADDAGEKCWSELRAEGVDLTRSRVYPGWSTPVTVSLATADDRAMATRETPPPEDSSTMIGPPPRSRYVLLDLDLRHPLGEDSTPTWADLARRDGARLIGDVGWDPTGRWDRAMLDLAAFCHAFVPNAGEAMAYTRTDTVEAAVAALAGVCPVIVVTDGARGATGIDAASGGLVHVPAVPVTAVDATGAGDVFGAALTYALARDWPLSHGLALAALCGGLAVTRPGGSAAAPTWTDIGRWWDAVRRDDQATTHGHGSDLRERYEFLDDALTHLPAR